MTRYSVWTAALALGTAALIAPATANAQAPKPPAGHPAPHAAPHPVAHAAPHPVAHAAAPHPVMHAAPHPVVRAAAPHPVAHAAPHPVAHAAPHPVAHAAAPHPVARAHATHAAPRTVRHAATPNHLRHAATPNNAAHPAAAQAQAQKPALSPAAQRRADRTERRHEQSVLRSLPPKERAAKRDEFREERAARENARANGPANPQAAVRPNAAQANALAQQRNAHRNHGHAITAQDARQGRFAARYAAHAHDRHNYARFAGDPVAARRAWHHHRRAGFVAWYGPVFWPYAYSDIFNYAFWPDGYTDGYWDYAYDDFFDGLFWGEQGAPTEYVYADQQAAPVASSASPVTYAAVEELCKQPGTGITAWPFATIEKKVGLNGEQKTLLSQLREAANKAAAGFKATCPSEAAFPLTPPGRLSAMTARLDATLQAVDTVRPALEAFYNSLSDEQKERFNELGPTPSQVAKAGGETTGATPDSEDSCRQPKPGLANLPIDKIEDAVKPTDDQELGLDKLQAATEKAVSVMQAACPDETPLTPTGRLAAMQKRLHAMVDAANTVKPALTDFYSSLSNEQKARFNNIGRELANSNG